MPLPHERRTARSDRPVGPLGARLRTPAAAAAWFTWALVAASGCRPAPAEAGPPPVVLVSFDTLRADRLGAYGHRGGLTPNLDRFARESVVFTSAWSQANETLYSHASLFTSRHPSELGPLDERFRLPGDVPLLAEVLRAYGYATGAFVGGGQILAEFGFDRGFDTFVAPRPWGSFFHTVPPALAWLDGVPQGSPFLLVVHGYDAHSRYLKPAPYGYLHADARATGPVQVAVRRPRGTHLVLDRMLLWNGDPIHAVERTELRMRSTEGKAKLRAEATGPPLAARALDEADIGFLRGVYDGAVRYADAWFGRLMGDLDRRGVLERAVVVVLSDHGEDLDDQGTFHHRFGLGDVEVRVPLMVRLPRARAEGTRVGARVALLDVLPTLLDLAGARAPAGARGRSLRAAWDGGDLPSAEAVYSQGTMRQVAVRADAGTLVFSGASADSPWLADLLELADTEGPAFGATPGLDRAARSALRDRLVAWARSLRPTPAGGGEPPAAVLEEVRRGGYWGAAP